MAQVLIVNADNTFTMSLGFALTARKHSVEVARSGLQALEIGFQIHPDLVIVDWVLSGHLNGLQVAEALRAALESTRMMMVSGYSSEALRSEAATKGLPTFLDRSIEMEEILRHIDAALETEPVPLPAALPLGYLQYEGNCRGRYASAGFRKMFHVKPEAPASGLIERIFSYYTKTNLATLPEEWLELKKRGASSAEFFGYVKKAKDGSCSLLVLAKEDEKLKDDPIVRTILGQMKPPAISERFIIIDENELQTRLAKSQIEGAGARCHTARSVEAALTIVRADPEANSALLDFRTAGQLDETVRRLTEIRSKLKIVGMCTAFRKREFESAGVNEFLVKPVIASVLFKALRVAAPTR